MPQKILVALGGNALQTSNSDSSEAQKAVAAHTAKQLAAIIKEGNSLVIAHGNGPQVGAILLNEESGAAGPAAKLDTCSAMSQGEIGYWLQQALQNELYQHNIEQPVATIVTQTLVDNNDPAFQNPSKPIGPFYDSEALATQAAEEGNFVIKEDAGRGWRRVVPSPQPIDIVESQFILNAINSGAIVIAAGGGGIPVIREQESLVGIEAVIDKDFAAAKLADLIEADTLLILTGVKEVSINYNTPEETPLPELTSATALEYIKQGQFAPGSMLPKIQAALQFVEDSDRRAIITNPESALAALKGEAGTIIIN